jgi:hypothetical protein
MIIVVVSPVFASALFWLAFCASVSCVSFDDPLDPTEPIARLYAYWDPLACRGRVTVDLEDEFGAPAIGSAPCAKGGLSIDLDHYGRYRGWARGKPVEVTIDAAEVRLRL